jgi:hypothetical protein
MKNYDQDEYQRIVLNARKVLFGIFVLLTIIIALAL